MHATTMETFEQLPVPAFIKAKPAYNMAVSSVAGVEDVDTSTNRWTEEGMTLYTKTCKEIADDRIVNRSFDDSFRQWRMQMVGANEPSRKRKAAVAEVYNDLGSWTPSYTNDVATNQPAAI